MRLFVAVELTDEVRRAVAGEQKRIAAALHGLSTSLRWVRPDHMHLTLVFLGDVSDGDVPPLLSSLGADLPLVPFDLTFRELGVFPPRGAPRVLWLGAEDAVCGLVELHRHIAQRVAERGIALERRPFHPHLTLARWRLSRPSDRERALAACGESLAAFDGRCIPAPPQRGCRVGDPGPGYVAPHSTTPAIVGRRALPAGRLARLGATPDFHRGLLGADRPRVLAQMRVERATLYQSRLSSAGPTYTALAHANLSWGAGPAERVKK